MKKYCIDIDGTICTDTRGDYKNAKPYKDRIAHINQLYDWHNHIIYFTARGGSTGKDWRKLTEKQLKEWGCKYQELIMGKPDADYFIDDKSIISDDYFQEQKSAIVTGGRGGIGRAIVDALTEMGYIVRVIDNAPTHDGTIEGVEFVENLWEMEKVFKQVKNLEVLVNCAGVAQGDWHYMLNINLLAPFQLSQLAYEKMKEGGCIINITSLWSERGFKGNPAYGVSKGGLKQLTKALAMDYAPKVRVNNIGLGYFKTNMTKYSWKNRRKKVTSMIPLKRWGKPEDVKEAIKFLVNAKYVTGQDIYIDGGWLANGGL
jgi:2-deoxy-D-gluconate 3-dehydrogenase